MKYSFSRVAGLAAASRSRARGETTVSAAIGRPASRRAASKALRLVRVALAVEDGERDVLPSLERPLELASGPRPP